MSFQLENHDGNLYVVLPEVRKENGDPVSRMVRKPPDDVEDMMTANMLASVRAAWRCVEYVRDHQDELNFKQTQGLSGAFFSLLAP